SQGYDQYGIQRILIQLQEHRRTRKQQQQDWEILLLLQIAKSHSGRMFQEDSRKEAVQRPPRQSLLAKSVFNRKQ
ncbi:MAG: hypothetical protein ACK56I_34810, partial [bacterium]